MQQRTSYFVDGLIRSIAKRLLLGPHLVFRVSEAESSDPSDVCAAGRSLFHRRRVEALHGAAAARLGAWLRFLVSKHELTSFLQYEIRLTATSIELAAKNNYFLRRNM